MILCYAIVIAARKNPGHKRAEMQRTQPAHDGCFKLARPHETQYEIPGYDFSLKWDMKGKPTPCLWYSVSKKLAYTTALPI